MSVTSADIRRAVRRLGLTGRAVCVHSSMRSFGGVDGGAAAVADAFLREGCTLLVPTFSSEAYEVWPDPPDVIPRNGFGGTPPAELRAARAAPRVFSPASDDIDRDMGVFPATVLRMPERVRGAHPLDSFTAVGPLARHLVGGQTPRNVYAPLEALMAADGAVLLIGVGLERLTLLHLAEQRAGRALFIRWALGSDGRVTRVAVGGCSEGFPKLAAVLEPLTGRIQVGASRWTLLPAEAAVRTAAAAIRADPLLTHCGNDSCDRCNDAALGGPVLT